jgi:hypothetical protein
LVTLPTFSILPMRLLELLHTERHYVAELPYAAAETLLHTRLDPHRACHRGQADLGFQGRYYEGGFHIVVCSNPLRLPVLAKGRLEEREAGLYLHIRFELLQAQGQLATALVVLLLTMLYILQWQVPRGTTPEPALIIGVVGGVVGLLAALLAYFRRVLRRGQAEVEAGLASWLNVQAVSQI